MRFVFLRGQLESFALLGHTVVRRKQVIHDLGVRTLVLDRSWAETRDARPTRFQMVMRSTPHSSPRLLT